MLLIGCSLGYEPSVSFPWALSAKLSGFNGDVVLLTDRPVNEHKDHINIGCIIEQVDRRDVRRFLPPYMFRRVMKLAPHVERFYHIEKYLRANESDYTITTDVKDVIFQKNVEDYILDNSYPDLIVSGEGIRYQDEAWGKKNLIEAYGFLATELMQHEVLNVGILAGQGLILRRLITAICSFSVGRPVKIADQAAFNLITRLLINENQAKFTSNSDAWCCNLGTSLDERIKHTYSKKQIGTSPIFLDGKYRNLDGDAYYIVHQYDRVPQNKPEILNQIGK